MLNLSPETSGQLQARTLNKVFDNVLDREVVLLKRDCSNSVAINSVAVEAGSKRASFTWSYVVGSLSHIALGPCMMSGGIVQARKDAANKVECLHVQEAVTRVAGLVSCLMLHTTCSRCPKPNTSRRRAGCIIAAANGQSSRESPRRQQNSKMSGGSPRKSK